MAPGKSSLFAKAKAVDPALDALFSASAGPVTAPAKTRYAALLPPRERTAPAQESEEDDGSEEDDDEQDEDEEASVDSEEDDEDGAGDSDEDSSVPDDAVEQAEAIAAELARTDRKRKRKADVDNEDLESRYLEKVMAEEEEPEVKRRKGETAEADEATATADETSDSDSEPMVHESLATKSKDQELELDRAARTVFLSNVSSEAVSNKAAKRTLLAHLSSILDKDAKPAQKVETLRFRSVAFSTASIPKRAAFITGATMDATTKSTNAYAVYSTTAAARKAVEKLNGTVVLDRHMRADSVAHPAPVAHRRCVFVGNLGFVDDETIINTMVGEDGKEKEEKRKRTKQPMDVEEGLWRIFGEHAGKVESVRVVRDQSTRVGKGIAYVQFYDANSVEAALLLAGKKFPPMLPRELRVTRCKAPHKTARALERTTQGKTIATPGRKAATGYVRKVTAEEQTLAGRTGKLLGKSAGIAAARTLKGGDKKRWERKERSGRRVSSGDIAEAGFKTPEAIMFEGRRASAKDGKPKDLKFKGANKGTKGARARASNNRKRQAARTSNWRKKGAKE